MDQNRVESGEIQNRGIWAETKQGTVMYLQNIAGRMGLRLPFDINAVQGGTVLSPKDNMSEADRKYLSEGRPIARILAKFGYTPKDNEFNRVLHVPSGEFGFDKRFDVTLMAYLRDVAKFVKEKKWVGKKGQTPIPEALDIGESAAIVKDPEGKKAVKKSYIVETELRKGYESIGKGGPTNAVHEIDISKIRTDEAINALFEALDAIHVKSSEFQDWIKENNIKIPKESWHSEENEFCALRGEGWWINPDRNKDDRLKELTRLAELVAPKEGKDNFIELRKYYNQYFDGKNFTGELEKMIRNNLPLYLHQDGTATGKNPKLLGEQVVAHGLISPSNMHLKKVDGTTQVMITGGDRSQLFGLRGQMVDWLIASCAASADDPDGEIMNKLINGFLNRYQSKDDPYQKEKRGLAMHVMYRAISEAHWYVEQSIKLEDASLKQSYTESAGRLVKLASEIIYGEGVWKDVDKPLEDISRSPL